jgi:glycosyltransferase involved in cell wall biosynthesis
LYANGQILEESLHGNFWREIWYGTWQDSVLKSAVIALVLKHLHRTGWLDSVKAWVCVSDFMRDKFIEAGIPKERAYGLRHAWTPLPEAPEPRDEGYYLFLSRLVDVKGVATLLEAWKLLEMNLGDQTPELRIGGEGTMEGLVKAAAERSRKIRFLGFVDGVEKQEQLRSCRAMLAPSIWWEPLGLVTYEAYDYGKPMLAARSGGLSETVQSGQTGFLHEPGDPQSLVDDVLKVEQMTPEQRQTMGKAGRAWLLANTNQADWKKRFNDILNHVKNTSG